MTYLHDVQPGEVQFLELLHETAKTLVYSILIRELKCVMKTHRGPKSSDLEADESGGPSRFEQERLAYERLDARGLTDKGIVPKYYGYLHSLDPTIWHPHLREFATDETSTNALFLEHIPNLSKFWLAKEYSELIENLKRVVTPLRVQKLREMFSEVQSAGVFHGDFYLRNLAIPDKDDRVLWMDFDSGRLRPENDAVPLDVAPWVPDKKRYWDRAFEIERATLNCLFRDIDDAVRTGDSFTLWKYSQD